MSARKYPFRFYGREPADWLQSPRGFLYDVQFAAPLDEEGQTLVRATAERHFSRGPAELGDVWRWGGGRFLVFSVKERFEDAPRMLFTQVAELLTQLHLEVPVRDVVFCNGVGSRADRWDAWSLKQSPLPDPGPARPDADWAQLLRRPEAAGLSWSGELGQAAAPAPQTAAPARAARPRLGLEPCEAPQADSVASRSLLAGWSRLEAAYAARGSKLRTARGKGARTARTSRVEGTGTPMLWELVGDQRRAILCLDGSGAPRRVELPEHAGSIDVAIDPDGLHAVTFAGQAVYSIDVAQGTIRLRETIHSNNGPVHGVAWVVDDLWAVACTNQIMVFDLSERDSIYVAAIPYAGALVGAFRNGTLLAARDGDALTVIGVCDWQMKVLGKLRLAGAKPAIVGDELYALGGAAWRRLARADEVYEAWAAPQRRRAERLRARRFRQKTRSTRPRWRWRSPQELPPDLEQERLDALRAKLGEHCAISLAADGSAAVAIPLPDRQLSRSAAVRWCPARGKPRTLKSAAAARTQGVTALSVDPALELIYLVTGTTFDVHRIWPREDRSEPCAMPSFLHYRGFLCAIVALDARNLLALWVDTLDWHRKSGKSWKLRSQERTNWPRGFAYNVPTRRLAITQQSRDRLRLYEVNAWGLGLVARFADDIKRISFRHDRLFAQTTDGQWFELEGLEPPRAPAPVRARTRARATA